MAPVKKTIKVIPLGGLYEIGKNITAIEYGKDIIVIDCGIAFPEDELLGIDAVIADFTYLKDNADRIRALVVTHGHEDHIGAIPYLLKEISVPIYGSRLSNGLIKNKLADHNIENVEMHDVESGDVITAGCIKVEFISVTHSIAGAFALYISTPAGNIFHTGDFKIDYTPIEGQRIDFSRIAEIGKKGVMLMLADSTNVERSGYTMSERSVGASFEQIFVNALGRIIIATFASNIHRVQQIFNFAVKYNRKVAIVGRSMETVINTAKELDYLSVPSGVIVEIDEINNYNDNEIVIICTGSQGEPMSALTRMAAREHKNVKIKRGDTVVLSASPIPGNEKMVSNVINDLFILGADVIYADLMEVHVSGHACQEELKLMHSLIKPKYFMPVHGEYRHLIQHGALAIQLGLDYGNVFILKNGDVLEINKSFAKITSSVPCGRVLVDGAGVGDVGSVVLKDRKILSQDGLFIIVTTLDTATNELVVEPEFFSRGFVYVKESQELMDEALSCVLSAYEKYRRRGKVDVGALKTAIRDNVREMLYENTKRRPMIMPIVIEV